MRAIIADSATSRASGAMPVSAQPGQLQFRPFALQGLDTCKTGSTHVNFRRPVYHLNIAVSLRMQGLLLI